MVIWDSPLFVVPWIDPELPEDEIWKALTEGVVKPPNAGTSAVRRYHTRRSNFGLIAYPWTGGEGTHRCVACP